ncbi:hypothetical protein HG535_0B03120 [Zygotorulaspora mrakii]|uniref:Uncharacterized protein n=1 Tax=Zygotorulaspora mrakii TaxID=42260 RepID=A0A7H9AYJ4_ZYGMR|nr:uncharacterized protein HG535_0B03120 [Zygotorulaspora mrakii]QLG71273.1 hypothetical protein HG535_0B03120 [Zygotorulaspora mrakii]
MTGTVELEQTVEKLSNMMGEVKFSPKNRDILNNLGNELVISQSKPVLEFVDIIIERFMYPRLPSKSLMGLLLLQECAIIDEESNDNDDLDNLIKYETFDLGHPRILELILIRQKLEELNSTEKKTWKSDEYMTKLLTKVQQVYVLLVHLLQVLSDHIEVPAHSAFYKGIVLDSIADFQRAFESFKILDFICQSLIRSVAESGKSDNSIFYVEDTLLRHIESFIQGNIKWYEDIMLQSTALKEFYLTEKKMLPQSIPSHETDLLHQKGFEIFLEKRKLRLRISTRRVF